MWKAIAWYGRRIHNPRVELFYCLLYTLIYYYFLLYTICFPFRMTHGTTNSYDETQTGTFSPTVHSNDPMITTKNATPTPTLTMP